MRYFQKIGETPYAAGYNGILRSKPTEVDKAIYLRTSAGDGGGYLNTGLNNHTAIYAAALGLMQAMAATMLGAVTIHRLAPGEKKRIEAPEGGYVMVLHAEGLLAQCGDETVSMKSNETWWHDPSQGLALANSTKDDATLVMVEMQVD